METITKNPFYTTKTVQLKYYLTKNDRLNEKLQHWTGVCKDISVCKNNKMLIDKISTGYDYTVKNI